MREREGKKEKLCVWGGGGEEVDVSDIITYCIII